MSNSPLIVLATTGAVITAMSGKGGDIAEAIRDKVKDAIDGVGD